MDYARIYASFIADRRIREVDLIRSGQYSERHHIVPKSKGGANDAANIICLTAEDHIFAHLFLARAHNSSGMWAAVKFIFGQGVRLNKAPTRRMIRIAAQAKEEFAKRNSGDGNCNFGRPMSDGQKERLRVANTGKKSSPEAIAKMSKSMAGNANAKGFKHSAETRLKVSLANTGKRHSEQSKAKIAAAHAGRSFSAETRTKMSAAKLGQPRAWVVTQETRDKLSAAHVGRVVSNEARAKQSKSRTGLCASPATKAKMSAQRSGSNNPRAQKVLCLSTGEIFGCLAEVAERFSVTASSFRSKIQKGGGQSSIGEFQFKAV